MSNDRGNDGLFELRGGPFVQGELRLLKFKGREAISKPFAFEILFESDLPPLELEAGLVGQSVTLVMRAAGFSPRLVHGIAAWVRVENAWKDEPNSRRYTLKLVPSVWRLSKRVNTRIFQDQPISDVITTVMKEASLAVRFDLSTPLPVRNYCVQYQESDFAFIRRLLAEAGCYYYFEPPTGLLEQLGAGAAGAAVAAVASYAGGAEAGAVGLVETMVVSDAASFYPAIASSVGDEAIERAAGAIGNSIVSNVAGAAPTLVHRDPMGMVFAAERTVHRIGLRRALRSNAVMLRDYIYERPFFEARDTANAVSAEGAAQSLVTAGLNDIGTALRGGSSGSIGAAALELLTGLPVDLIPREVYRHKPDFRESDAKSPNGSIELEQHRRRLTSAEGQSFCRRLTAGYKFALSDHEDGRMNRVWVVTSVQHRGFSANHVDLSSDATQYENNFTAAPAELTIRPRRPPPRAVQVADTAVVVGPVGEEVYTDEYGRIKVQFHWDRVGQKNEHSSCWIRVLHAWSGAAWGTQFIPRIGMEVLVLYHQGDPDRPVVIGCLPNAATPQPFMLPDDATRSGIRTNTLPTSGGHNELSFEDKRGNEQVYIRAERDFDENVQHDHTLNVGHDQRQSVGGSRTSTVSKDDTLAVSGAWLTSVLGDRTDTIGGARHLAVQGDALDSIGGADKRTVTGSAFLTTKGSYELTIDGAWNSVVGTKSNPQIAYTAVWGQSTLFASDVIRIQSEASIVLECGESVITMTPDQVKIAAKAIVLDGHESTTIYGKKPVLAITDTVSLNSDTITLTAQSSSLTLDSNATLLGTQVKLASGSSSTTQTRQLDPAQTKPFQVNLADGTSKPYANLPYDMMVGGQRFSGSTDGSGGITQTIPKDAKLADITVWLGPAPTGKNLRWQVHIEDQIPGAPASMGLMMRLRNLGFHTGDIDEDDADARQIALQRFQITQPDAPKDGVVAGNTIDLLTKTHGF